MYIIKRRVSMRSLWIIIIVVAILGGTAAVEIWSYMQYKTVEYEPNRLPSLQIGVRHEYDYYSDSERVGYHVFWVEDRAQYNGEVAYFVMSNTSVGAVLETVYILNEELVPLEYRLNATMDGDRQTITCLFDGWSVDATMTMNEGVIEESSDLPEDTVLLDYFILGHWYLFFKSFTLAPGRRVTINTYIPRILNCKSIELLVNKKSSKLKLNGVEYECLIVRATELNLVFYLSDGDIIKMEDIEQDVTLSLVS